MYKKAREFAVAAHGEQRYGTQPYAYHLDEVVALLTPYGEQAMLVGYLHDVVEDTHVTLDEVATEFGPFVAQCVAILSDEPGENRQQRKAKTYQKMAAVQGETTLALIVKTADRLANVTACIETNNQRLLALYQKEQPAFYQAAYRAGLCDDLWQQLEKQLKT